MENTNRREFLRSSAAAAAASAFAAPAIAKDKASANDRVRVALLGLGGRMHWHVRALAQMTDEVEIVAVCDCDQKKLDSAAKAMPALEGKKLTTYTDMRKMFDDKSIDAVDISLGDRWHALSTIWACQAGKDVYVEKPPAHNLFESRQMVAAARKYNRMVQVGMQMRSSPNIIEGIQKLKEGVVGDVYMARGVDFKLRGNLGTIKPSPVPAGLDWDKWLGPKPMHEYSTFWHRRWYFNLELANGPFANQAVHLLDVIRWGLGLEEHPTRVTATCGTFVHEDDRTSPTHTALTFQFDKPKTYVTYEHRSWYTNSEAGFRDEYPFMQRDFPVGTIFLGSKGYLIFPDYSSYRTFLGLKCKPGPKKVFDWFSEKVNVDSARVNLDSLIDVPHFQNWIAACRARDHKVLSADIEDGHKSMALCLLARTAYQVDRPVNFDPATETITGDEEADAMLNKPTYREPYVVPNQV